MIAMTTTCKRTNGKKAHEQSFFLYIIRDQYFFENKFYGVTSFLEEVKIPLPGPLCHKFWSPPYKDLFWLALTQKCT